MSATIKTVFRSYRFDIHNKEQAEAYKALKASLKAQGLRCFETHGGKSHYIPALDGATVELETEHLFDNQWNTRPMPGDEIGKRVFDWAQDYPSTLSGCPKNIKRGHYLEQTAGMREVRATTCKCGYCGKQEPASKSLAFCPHCIGSEYLKVKDLHLTRMLPISSKDKREALTDAELYHLMPIYKDAQLKANTERASAAAKRAREHVEANYLKSTRCAQTKRDGFIWFLDRGIRVDNLIYYDHTNRFTFGWRTPVDTELVDSLLDVISEFPYAYEIICEDGRKLSGNIG